MCCNITLKFIELCDSGTFLGRGEIFLALLKKNISYAHSSSISWAGLKHWGFHISSSEQLWAWTSSIILEVLYWRLSGEPIQCEQIRVEYASYMYMQDSEQYHKVYPETRNKAPSVSSGLATYFITTSYISFLLFKLCDRRVNFSWLEVLKECKPRGTIKSTATSNCGKVPGGVLQGSQTVMDPVLFYIFINDLEKYGKKMHLFNLQTPQRRGCKQTGKFKQVEGMQEQQRQIP